MIPEGCHIPETADALLRPRLHKRLSRYDRCRVILVTGQAAQGKSTLVAAFLKNSRERSLWFHLDRVSSDNSLLFDRLIRELTRSLRSRDRDTDAGKDIALPPHTPLGSRQDLLRQIDILGQLMGRYGQGLNIVFDDMETLDEKGAASDLIEGLIRESPDGVRFFLISRSQPAVNLFPFKMNRQVLTLTNADLAFTMDEAMAFFTAPGRLPEGSDVPGQDTIEKILKATEGWVGGLVLVSEAIRQARSLNHLPDHLTAEAFSYFSSEIYQTLAPEIRDFLLKTAIFDELDTKILSLFFDTVSPKAVLAELEKRNLFIRRVRNDSGRSVYRYNALFKDFLTADLLESAGREGVCQLNQKAGKIYLNQKDSEKAVFHFRQAGCYNEIARIIRITGTDYVITGRTDRLAEWIADLPGAMRTEDPWLILYDTMSRRIRGGATNIRAFAGALEGFRGQSDIRGQLLSIAYLIEASVFIRQPSQVILKWIRAGEQALEGLKGKHHFSWARTLLWQQIGLGYIAGNGDIPKGLSACKNAVLLARQIQNSDLLINAFIIETLGLVQSGDLSGARAMLDKTRTTTTFYPEYRALKNITNADLALKHGNMALTDELLSKSEADIDKFGLIFLYPGTVEVRALYHVQTGQFDQAVQAADHLSDFSILDGNDFYLGISHRIKAVASLCRDRYSEAVDWARKAIQELDQSRRGDIHLSLARQILGISLYHKGDHGPARKELEAVLAYFRSIGADLGVSETALCLGMLFYDAGDHTRGTGYLKAGLEKAMENNYCHIPLIDHRILARVLVMACFKQVVPGRKLADFLTGFNAPDLLNLVAKEIDAILRKLSKRQRPVASERLAVLFKLTRPKIMICTLGLFCVQLDTKFLPASVFGGPKPMQLLKLIVVKGGIDIPKEVLIDSLWPDATVVAGEKNLKVNLHRLRKALEPSPSKDFGNVYLSNKDGLISLDFDLVRIDTRLFTAFFEEGYTHEDRGRFTEALDAYDRAIGLYRGDYFAGDPYLPDVGNAREFFRLKSMAVLEKKAALHEELDQWQAAVDAWQALLGMDACHETAYQNLMILHADAGMKSGAVHIFERCRAVLKAELDASPGPDTLEIYRKVTAI